MTKNGWKVEYNKGGSAVRLTGFSNDVVIKRMLEEFNCTALPMVFSSIRAIVHQFCRLEGDSITKRFTLLDNLLSVVRRRGMRPWWTDSSLWHCPKKAWSQEWALPGFGKLPAVRYGTMKCYLLEHPGEGLQTVGSKTSLHAASHEATHKGMKKLMVEHPKEQVSNAGRNETRGLIWIRKARKWGTRHLHRKENKCIEDGICRTKRKSSCKQGSNEDTHGAWDHQNRNLSKTW